MLARMPRTNAPTVPSPSADEVDQRVVAPTVPVCPYLQSAARGWVASGPSSDHRCEAVAPAAALALDKQRRLCLTAQHETCATYVAALAARASRDPGTAGPPPGWGWVRTTPVVDGSVGLGASVAAVMAERRGWQVVPAIALVGVLAVLVLSNLGAAGPSPSPTTPAAASASPTVVVTPAPSAEASPTAPPTPVPTPTSRPTPPPTPAPTARPTPTPAPASRTYTVKSGDTLYDIALKFGVSVGSIEQLNGLTSTVLHVGQVLKIP